MAPPDELALGEAELAAGRWLFERETVFLKGASDLTHLPPDNLAEVAFCGRSNVGKSSLLNALTGRKTLARTSNTPGRTREVNYFVLPAGHPAGVYLVDLPGYGYAKAPKTQVAAWTRLTMAYLRGRASLRRAFLLIDARHGLKSSDEEAMAMFDEAAVSYQIVLTKADKLKPGALARMIEATQTALRKHAAAYPVVIATSSVTGDGLDEVRAEIARFLDMTALGYNAP